MSNRLKRNICFALSILFSFVIPAAFVVIKYDMIDAFHGLSNKTKVSIIGGIVLLIVIICNMKKIKNYIESIEFSIWKCLINGFIKLLPLACLFVLLVNLDLIIDDLTLVSYCVLECNVVSLFVFDPLWRYFAEESKQDAEYKARRKRELNG